MLWFFVERGIGFVEFEPGLDGLGEKQIVL
jgi:hypothetical protein